MSCGRRLGAALGTGLLVGVLAIGGCSDDEAGGRDASEEVEGDDRVAGAEEEASGSSSADAGGSDGEAGGGEGDGGGAGDPLLTPPGTELGLGETAVVPVVRPRREAVVSVAVTGIERGAPAELDGLDLAEGTRGAVPYYVHATFEPLLGDDLGQQLLDTDLEAYLASGVPAQRVEVAGTFEPCQHRKLPSGAGQGTVTESCGVFLAPEGSVVERVGFAGRDFGGPYRTEPVVWTAP